MTDLSAENQILICIARRSLDAETSERLRALAQLELDWNYVLLTASNQNVLPLLYKHIQATIRDLVPEPVLAALRSEFLNNSQSNLYLVRELVSTLKLLSTNGIQALAFKGPVLGAMLYGDVGLRQAGDLDILIARKDFSRAQELLQGNCYVMDPPLTRTQMSSHLRCHCEIQFRHRDEFCVVDLHWGLVPNTFPLALNPKDLFARAQSISLAGYGIQTLGREDLLLYLCMHGAKHYWARLEWIASVAELIRSQEDIDWNLVVNRARESRVEDMLYLALLLAKNLFGIELPQQVRLVIEERTSLRRCAEKIEERLFGNPPRSLSKIEMFRSNLEFMDRKRDVVIGVLRSIIVPTISDWRLITLPGILYPLYYLVRPLRLAGKYGGAILRLSKNVGASS